jgi:hypothetical protein
MLNDLGLESKGLESFLAGEINVDLHTLEPLPIGAARRCLVQCTGAS